MMALFRSIFGSDDEDEPLPDVGKSVNGASPVRPLVDYPDDDDDEGDDDVDDLSSAAPSVLPQSVSTPEPGQNSPETSKSPPERLSEKRRREEDEEDELLANISSSSTKRRASLNSNSSSGSLENLRRKNANLGTAKENGGGPKKIAISLSSSPKEGPELATSDDEEATALP